MHAATRARIDGFAVTVVARVPWEDDALAHLVSTFEQSRNSV
jgi:hypothetical protein